MMDYPDLVFERGDVLTAENGSTRYSDRVLFAPLSNGDRVLVTEVIDEGEDYRANRRRGFRYKILGEDDPEERTMRIRGVGSDGSRWSFQNGKAHGTFEMVKDDSHPAN